MPRNPKVEFDMLKMYFGEPYVIDCDGIPGTITVLSPTIGDIIQVGEKRFYQTLNMFITNTTQYRLVLWDMHQDWNTISDFELFSIFYKQADPDVVKLLFGDLDLQKFEPLLRQPLNDQEKPELILWDEDDGIGINADVHNHFSQYLRCVFNTFPDEKITQSEYLKSLYIARDRRALDKAQKDAAAGKVKDSGLQPLISACINHPGFKYKLKELKDVGVFEFFDSVSRLQIYEQSTALMKGMYSGFIDGKSIKPEDYNFMREIIRDTNNSVSKANKLKDQG